MTSLLLLFSLVCPLAALDCQCGVKKETNNLNVRVYGGEEALPNEFPWVALVLVRNVSSRDFVTCGGTLISDRHVLTAAHCIEPGNIYVVLGEGAVWPPAVQCQLFVCRRAQHGTPRRDGAHPAGSEPSHPPQVQGEGLQLRLRSAAAEEENRLPSAPGHQVGVCRSPAVQPLTFQTRLSPRRKLYQFRGEH